MRMRPPPRSWREITGDPGMTRFQGEARLFDPQHFRRLNDEIRLPVTKSGMNGRGRIQHDGNPKAAGDVVFSNDIASRGRGL